MTATYPIDPARALPAESYRAPAFEAERSAIWRNGWVFVGTADQVAEPGDWFTTSLGGQPVIVLRTQEGDLAALSNLCAHRGTLLVEGTGNSKRFQCPYHAWTYGDDGRLLAVPHADRDELDRSALCLPGYRAEVWQGLVFASMRHDVASLSERFAHLDHLVASRGLDQLHHWTEDRGDEVWEANWKLVIANAMESYHLFAVHAETLEPYSPTAGAYYLTGNANGSATGGRSSRAGDGDYVLLSLPPNLVGVILDGSFLWQAVEPIAHDRTRVITGAAYASTAPSDSAGVAKWAKRIVAGAAGAVIPDFLPEDKAICERGQRGASGDFEPGPILDVERVLVDFHHYLARQLHGFEA